jgi:hypothetical protein
MTIGVGGGSAGWASSAAPPRPVTGEGTTCVLTANGPLPPASPTAVVPPSPTRHPHHGYGAGNVVVAIPRTVFIHVIGQWLVVTTNTGAPPQPTDTFYAIANSHATIADESLRQRVELGCAAR